MSPSAPTLQRYNTYQGPSKPCNVCRTTFPSMLDLRNHYLEVHDMSISEDIICPWDGCGQLFRASVFVTAHYRTHIPVEKRRQCEERDKKVLSQLTLEFHNAIHSTPLLPELSSSRSIHFLETIVHHNSAKDSVPPEYSTNFNSDNPFISSAPSDFKDSSPASTSSVHENRNPVNQIKHLRGTTSPYIPGSSKTVRRSNTSSNLREDVNSNGPTQQIRLPSTRPVPGLRASTSRFPLSNERSTSSSIEKQPETRLSRCLPSDSDYFV